MLGIVGCYFPVPLLELAGCLGIGIALSVYPDAADGAGGEPAERKAIPASRDKTVQ